MNFILIIVTIIILISLCWRLLSNRHKIPCPAWLAWMVELDNPFAKAHKAISIIEALPKKEGMKVLDIGCGPGRVLIPLAQEIKSINGFVTGLDVQEEMISKTRKKVNDLKILNANFIEGDFYKVQFDTKFDVITMICVLGEVPKNEHELFIKKVYEIIAQNGVVSITETIFDPHFQTHKYVKKIMKNLGFTEIKFIGNSLAYTVHFKRNSKRELGDK